jgi:prevent-host-death family protein
METWGLAQAKANFSEVVAKAMTEGPQEIRKGGKDAVVIVSKKEWERTQSKPKESIVEFFRRSPAYGQDVDFKRINLKMRKVDF